MGYMGFGMRREVYTRKPKQVFAGFHKKFTATGPRNDFSGRPSSRPSKTLSKYLILPFVIAFIFGYIYFIIKLVEVLF